MMTATLFEVASTTSAPRGLERFHAAHAYKNSYRRAYTEIMQGVKRSHWMWFVFPQLVTYEGASRMTTYYGLADKAEAAAYLADPVLRLRLGICTQGVLRQKRLMFGEIDRKKLRASMTLFAQVADDPRLLNLVLEKFFDGPDQHTLELLKAQEEGTVARYWEKQIKKVQEVQASVGRHEPEQYATPWTRSRIESFLAGFQLSSVARRRIVEAWIEDGERSRDAGWEAHADYRAYEEG